MRRNPITAFDRWWRRVRERAAAPDLLDEPLITPSTMTPDLDSRAAAARGIVTTLRALPAGAARLGDLVDQPERTKP